MTRLDLIPDCLSLLGGIALTWPALRAGRMLGRAATAARDAAQARDAASIGIFRKIQNAYVAAGWRPSDQRWLWAGLTLAGSGGIWSLVLKWHMAGVTPGS